jgi:hypothetical protein
MLAAKQLVKILIQFVRQAVRCDEYRTLWEAMIRNRQDGRNVVVGKWL